VKPPVNTEYEIREGGFASAPTTRLPTPTRAENLIPVDLIDSASPLATGSCGATPRAVVPGGGPTSVARLKLVGGWRGG
jgi:hypothetical protein